MLVQFIVIIRFFMLWWLSFLKLPVLKLVIYPTGILGILLNYDPVPVLFAWLAFSFHLNTHLLRPSVALWPSLYIRLPKKTNINLQGPPWPNWSTGSSHCRTRKRKKEVRTKAVPSVILEFNILPFTVYFVFISSLTRYNLSERGRLNPDIR